MSANSPPRVSKKRRENDRERKEREEGRKQRKKGKEKGKKEGRKEGRSPFLWPLEGPYPTSRMKRNSQAVSVRCTCIQDVSEVARPSAGNIKYSLAWIVVPLVEDKESQVSGKDQR